jgi:DNA-binding CsgD family transcriptional regulator
MKHTEGPELKGLQAIGLNSGQEAAYELLIDRPAATIGQLDVDWHRPEDLPAILIELEVIGLVRRLRSKPGTYAAVAPDLALDALLLDNEQQLRRARQYADGLVIANRAQLGRADPGTVIELVTGVGPVQQRILQIQRSVRSEIRCLDKSPYADLSALTVAEFEALPGSVGFRAIYDRAAVDQPAALGGIEGLVQAGQRARVLPTLPLKLHLCDDRLAVLPLHREAALTQAIVIVHPSALLEALGNLFEGLWQRALPLDLAATKSARSVSADDQRVVALLLSGLTDEAIARQLGVSLRTAQRRIAALIDRLGVHTRFQAGVRAALRDQQTRS